MIGSRVLAEGHGGGLARQFYGSGFNLLVRMALGLPYRDTQAGLKGLRGTWPSTCSACNASTASASTPSFSSSHASSVIA